MYIPWLGIIITDILNRLRAQRPANICLTCNCGLSQRRRLGAKSAGER